MRQWILLMVLIFMVSGCSAATWSQMHQAGMRNLANSGDGTGFLNESFARAFTDTGNVARDRAAAYQRGQQRQQYQYHKQQYQRDQVHRIHQQCLMYSSIRPEYERCMYDNGVR